MNTVVEQIFNAPVPTFDEKVTRYLVDKVGRDLDKSISTLSIDEIRYLVGAYYQMQRQRIRAGNQVFALSNSQTPHEIFAWYQSNTLQLEKYILKVLDHYGDSRVTGRWAKSIRGIGPVIAAALEAHIDIEKALKVSALWAFAGLDPTRVWGKGEKRPWNAELKVACWKAGESFVKVSGHPRSFYGKLYRERKVQEIIRNTNLEFKDQAEAILAAKRIGKDTEAYKVYSIGMLPAAHIHARAKRYAVKIFLSHWHQVAYRERFGEEAPKPWVIAHGGHVDFISVDDVNDFENGRSD